MSDGGREDGASGEQGLIEEVGQGRGLREGAGQGYSALCDSKVGNPV